MLGPTGRGNDAFPYALRLHTPQRSSSAKHTCGQELKCQQIYDGSFTLDPGKLLELNNQQTLTNDCDVGYIHLTSKQRCKCSRASMQFCCVQLCMIAAVFRIAMLHSATGVHGLAELIST